MRFGLSSYSLTWSVGVPGYEKPCRALSAKDLLYKAKESNVTVLQIADNLPLHEISQTELVEIAGLSKQFGIIMEVGTRGTSPELLSRYLKIAKQLDSNIVRTLITLPDIEQALLEIKEVLPDFTDAGICIAIENHGLHTTKQLCKLFDQLSSPYVGCCLDTVNSLGALECPDQVIDALAPYVINLHVKDFNINRVKHQMGFEIMGTPAGSGKLDLPRLISKFEALGKNPNAILELWTPFTDTIEDTIALENKWFLQSIEYMKTLFTT